MPGTAGPRCSLPVRPSADSSPTPAAHGNAAAVKPASAPRQARLCHPSLPNNHARDIHRDSGISSPCRIINHRAAAIRAEASPTLAESWPFTRYLQPSSNHHHAHGSHHDSSIPNRTGAAPSYTRHRIINHSPTAAVGRRPCAYRVGFKLPPPLPYPPHADL